MLWEYWEVETEPESSAEARARRMFAVCFRGRVSVCVCVGGGNGQVLHGWREKPERFPICSFHREIRGTASSQVLHPPPHPPPHREAFNGAENQPSAPENPPRNSLFPQARDSLSLHTTFSFCFFFLIKKVDAHSYNKYVPKTPTHKGLGGGPGITPAKPH